MRTGCSSLPWASGPAWEPHLKCLWYLWLARWAWSHSSHCSGQSSKLIITLLCLVYFANIRARSHILFTKRRVLGLHRKKRKPWRKEKIILLRGGGVGEIKCNHYLHKATEVGFPWALFQLCLSPPFLFPFLFKDLKKKQCKMKSWSFCKKSVI